MSTPAPTRRNIVDEHRQATQDAHEREEAWHDEQEQTNPDYWKA